MLAPAGAARFAKRFAYSNDYIYLRLEASMTAKVFARELLRLLHYRYDVSGEGCHGSTSTLFRRCINELQAHPDAVIVIDEIDYAFNQPMLLGSIRDIVDETLAIILLVGMTNAKEKLLKANAHYFDRCNYFYEFQRLSRADVELVCMKVSDVRMESDLLTYIHKTTHGNFRQIIKIIEAVEKVASTRNLVDVALTDLLETQELKNAS